MLIPTRRVLAISLTTLILPAIFAADDVGIAPAPTAASSIVDSRISKLEKFFDRYRCGKPYPVRDYLRVADGYGLDYRVLPAISIRESGCGKSAKPLNNLWGFHQQDFASIKEGIEFLANRLMQHPYYKQKTLQQKLFTYNPKAAYPEEILRIMRQIE